MANTNKQKGEKDIVKKPWKKEDNLTPFTSERQPKNSGRKKGSLNLSTLLKEALKGEIDLTEGNKTRKVTKAQAIILKQIENALKGDQRGIDSVYDRTEGKPLQKQELSGPDGNAIPVSLTNFKDLSDAELQGLATGEGNNSTASRD